MGFFSNKQKKIALSNSRENLETAYHISEKNLKDASMSGDEKRLKTAMKQHGDFEYAMLYKNTPEYKCILKKKSRRKDCKRNSRIR